MMQDAAANLAAEGAAAHRPGERGRSPLVHFLRDLSIVVALMVALAGGLALMFRANFLLNLRYCLAIGITTHLVTQVFLVLGRTSKPDWKIIGGSLVLGAGPGYYIGSLANGLDPLALIRQYPNSLFTVLAISLVCTLGISYYFYSRGVIAETTAALRQEALESVSYQQRLTEANFKVLQAQIEPHFLFNTLSNILSLIRTRPDQAEQMLGNFTEYLRASLHQTRVDRIALQDELTTIRAFLDIMSVRMEHRLRYRIDVPQDLRHLMIPPLLLQPLVENAIEHGIDPKPEGGEVAVRAARDGELLILEVSDSGDGIASSNPMGVGMANIRDRLQLLYHGRAGLQVKLAVPHGTTVRLTIPTEGGGHHA